MRSLATIPVLMMLGLPGCFEEPPFDVTIEDDFDEVPTGGGATEPMQTPDLPLDPDPGSDSDSDSDADADSGLEPEPEPEPQPECGDGTHDPDEACDDGNVVSGDGCSDTCHVETTGCAAGATAIADDVERGMSICEDPDHEMCEESFASLCAPGWHLCSAREHMVRNDEWLVPLVGQRALGVVRCRALGGAGHYTVHTPAADGTDNCQVGSSRAECPSALGCDETFDAALCCARVPTCGDGVVDEPYEECDDGNESDADACSRHCASTFGSGPDC